MFKLVFPEHMLSELDIFTTRLLRAFKYELNL